MTGEVPRPASEYCLNLVHGAQIMGSEVGVVDIPNWDIASKGRLMPGNIFLVDFDAKRVIKDDEVPPSLLQPAFTSHKPGDHVCVWPWSMAVPRGLKERWSTACMNPSINICPLMT